MPRPARPAARPATAPAALPIHRSQYGAMEVVDAPYQSLSDNEQQQQPPGVRTQARPRPRRPQAKGKGGCLGVSREEWFKGVLYGLINASICLPASISFSTIIFRHEAFAPYLPVLVRLVLLSSAVHATIFVWLSSMPFAVGQVQDAGLIFLSSMASTLADYCRQRELSDAVLLSTTLVLLSLSTALVGLSLIIMGKLRLASAVTYIPMAAVSGYLAFIGLFAFNAGLSFMTQTQLDSVASWRHLDATSDLLKLAPGLFLGIGMFIALRRIHHVLTLPGTLALSVVIFYVILSVLGLDLSQAQALGWVAPPVPSTPFYEAWQLFDLRLVRWEAVPLILPSWVALTLVVAFSSSLDVAAIEMEKKQPLQYDYELQMIGLSNLVSGLTGGYTGSYIFSQTIFSLRRGISTRVCSSVIALVELVAFLAPVSLIAYIPRFFFGGLLVLIGTDLMLEWLWMSRKKMMAPEYAVTLATFVAIQLTNIEVGMGIGVLLAVVAFTISYAEAPLILHPRVRHSSVVRTFEERAILSANMDKTVTLSLRGYVFFGSAVKILREIKENVLAGHVNTMPAEGGGEGGAEEEVEKEDVEEEELVPVPFSSPSAAMLFRGEGSGGGRGRHHAAAGGGGGLSSIASSLPASSSMDPLMTRVKSAPRLVPPFASLGGSGGSGGATAAAAAAAAGIATSAGGGMIRGGSEGRGRGGRQRPLTTSSTGVRGGFPGSLLLLSGRSLGGGGGGGGGEGSGSSSVRDRDVLTPVYHRGGVWLEAGAAASATSSSRGRQSGGEEEEGEEEGEEGMEDGMGEDDLMMMERRSAFGNGRGVLEAGNSGSGSGSGGGSSTLGSLRNGDRTRIRANSNAEQGLVYEDEDEGEGGDEGEEEGEDSLSVPLFSRNHSRTSQNRSSSAYTATGTSYDTAQEFMDSLSVAASPFAGTSPVGGGRSPLRPPPPAEQQQQQLPPLRLGERSSSNGSNGSNRSSSSSSSTGHRPSSSLSAALAQAAQQQDGVGRRCSNKSNSSSSSNNNALIDFYLREWSEEDQQAADGEGGVRRRGRSRSNSSSSGGGAGAGVHVSTNGHPPLAAAATPVSTTAAAASASAVPNRIRWLVFDFSQVVGIDATAARSCFLMLKSLLKGAQIRVVFASLAPKIERLLRGHGVLDEEDPVFGTVDEALEFCEEELLQSAAELSDEDLIGLSRHPSFYATVRRSRRLTRKALGIGCRRRDRLLLEAQEALDLESILADYLEVSVEEEEEGGEEGGGEGGRARPNRHQHRVLAQYFQEAAFEAEECLFKGGEASDKLYFIRKGVVELQVPSKEDQGGGGGGGGAGGGQQQQQQQQQRLQKVSAGGSVGELGFFLKRPQIFTAVATTPVVVYYLTRPRLLALAKAHPQLACVLTFAVIKSIALASSYAISDFADVTLLLKHREGVGAMATPGAGGAEAGVERV